MENILQFKYSESIPAVLDENEEIIEPAKTKYEFLGTSNTLLPNCDYELESYTQEELEQIQSDWFLII